MKLNTLGFLGVADFKFDIQIWKFIRVDWKGIKWFDSYDIILGGFRSFRLQKCKSYKNSKCYYNKTWWKSEKMVVSKV